MSIRQRLTSARTRWLLLLAVIGPGIITTNVDNDAGGITTYSVAGAHFGYSLLWMLPLAGLALVFAQEMSARLGVVTGKGLADLIREKTGVRWTAADHWDHGLYQSWPTRSASSPAWLPAWSSLASASTSRCRWRPSECGC